MELYFRHILYCKYLPISGILAPILFFGFVIAGALLTPGYSNVSDAISKLASHGTPHPEWMNAGFISYGVLMIGMAYALKQILPAITKSKIVWSLVIIHGICFVLLSIFPDDPVQSNNVITLTGILHHVVSIAGILAFIIGILIFFNMVSDESTWRNIYKYYIFAVTVFLLLFIVSLIPAVREINGLLQRVSAFVMAVFIELFSIKCLAISINSLKNNQDL